MEYKDPFSDTTVRVMPGKSYSPNPCQQKPYVVYRKGKKAIDKFGNIVSPKSEEAHIPLEEFVFREIP